MKKMILFSAIALFAVACGSADKKAKVMEPTKPSKHSDEFNTSFRKLLIAYYELKDAFVKSDAAAADKAALQLAMSGDSLKWGDIKDTSLVYLAANQFVKSISLDASSIPKTTGIEEKRKTFATISENLYPLIQTVRYDREIIYHQNCPMAFNDAGANWLSNYPEIKNPYFGEKMLECGKVTDSLKF